MSSIPFIGGAGPALFIERRQVSEMDDGIFDLPAINVNLSNLGDDDPARRLMIMVYGWGMEILSRVRFGTSGPDMHVHDNDGRWLVASHPMPTGSTATIRFQFSTSSNVIWLRVYAFRVLNMRDTSLAYKAKASALIQNTGSGNLGPVRVRKGGILIGLGHGGGTDGNSIAMSNVDNYDNYHDGTGFWENVDSTENKVLGLTMNNGGGTASMDLRVWAFR